MQAIVTKDLSKTYFFCEKETGFGGSIRALLHRKKVFLQAVREINLDIGIGELVGFIGPNGAGKTTTLKMLAGILHPSSGSAHVLGYLPHKREKSFLKSISFITGQRNRLFWDLPAEDYFSFLKVVYEIPEAVYQKNKKYLVELADIGNLLKVPQRKLSVGERKRCELVGALLHDPQVVFLDEPTNALDLINARRVREFIKEKGREGKYTIILASHNVADIEQVCERIVVINAGTIVYDGSLEKLGQFNGVKKQMKIVFCGPWRIEKIEELGTIKKKNSQEVTLEVEAGYSASVASKVLASFPVQDISIANPPIEEIIESIYMRPLKQER